MKYRIADTFTDSLAKLKNEEQKAVKTTAFDLQTNPAHPGMKLHRLQNVKDPHFWSIRVNLDIRLIIHKTETGMLLCYVDHHDDAYRWAERRKLETHPKTGAAQLVIIRETVREVTVSRYVDKTAEKPLLFKNIAAEELLGYGVPTEWLADVQNVDEDSLLDLTEHLPGEAAEALLDLATGGKPKVKPLPVSPDISPFDHPDALRRFRVMNDVEELARALDFPWEKWTLFLHPDQEKTVERHYKGPARISGTAGTGKTIVALHRAVFLAKTNPEARILLTTFSDTLANALSGKLRRLISDKPRLGERLEVHSMSSIGRRLYEANFKKPDIAGKDTIQKLIDKASAAVEGHKFGRHFLISEWSAVVDSWQLETWEEYRDVRRLGRKTRLAEKQRAVLWSIFERVRSGLKEKKLMTDSAMFTRLAEHLAKSKNPRFDFAIVDEAQDIGIAQLRFLAALGANRPNGLFLAGDLGQRIFQQPFSWKALGVDIRGRSSTLRINYRTSHQIRRQADRLLDPEISDIDGNKEKRNNATSIFNGPKPAINVPDSVEEEIQVVGKWIQDRMNEGVKPHEIGVFVRSAAELDRGKAAVENIGIKYKVLDENVATITGHISVSTMHLAKGLEFRAVAVMACDDEVIPSQERIDTVADDTGLEEVYNTERHLLYVACTRARDHLLVSGVDPASEFIDDLGV
ncbi:3'-5' exonuclease [Desulfobacterales bacterium HSG16]|nr:3'-5' exonuclease [Desulfobacterales bacterium HSG16]